MGKLSLFHLMLTVIILCAAEILHTASVNATLREGNALHVTSRLTSHIRPHDGVAVATCRSHWDEINHFWLKRLPWAVTTWKLRQLTMFRSYVRRNMDKNVNTDILVNSLAEYASTCLDSYFNFNLFDVVFFYRVDWILLEPDDESIATLRHYVSQTPSRNFSCELGGNSSDSKGVLTVPTGPVLFTRACVERKGQPLIGKHSELRNTVIRAACIDITHLRPANNTPSCNSYEIDIIFDAIKTYNVTVDLTFYSSSLALAGDMFKGLIDVHRNLQAAIPAGRRHFCTPGVIAYWYETFYAQRKGPMMLSLYDILMDSKLTLTLVAISLVLTLTFLLFAHAHRVRSCSANEVTISFMFLLASFFSTSYSMPRIGRWSVLAGLVCGVWLMVMLPFSNYFRGELTSRVTLRPFPDHVDTLAKLERALDEQKMAPCVVKDTFLHERLTKNFSIGNIQRKLRLAFQGRKEKGNLAKSSYNDCLQCALREDLVCYLFSLPSWYNHPYKQMIIESKEHLSPMLLTFAVRFNYPHKAGLRELVRKIVEARLIRRPEHLRRESYLRNFDEQDSLELSPLKLEELTSFLQLYMASLAAAALVFVLEMTIRASKAPTEALAVHA